jgi:hypothetical protein
MIYALAKCLNRSSAFEFNNKKGLFSYYGPYEELLCVNIENVPAIENYFLDPNKSSPTPNEITALSKD